VTVALPATAGQAQSVHILNPWCEEDDLPAGRLRNVTDVDRQTMILAATETLYRLSGRQYRSGRSIIRPTPIGGAYGNQSYLYPYSSMSGYGAAWGFAAGWAWSAVGMGWWQNGQDLSEVVLQGPVQRINDVMVNGTSLGPWPPANSNYTLYDGRRLIRNTDGAGQNVGAWPWNQQLQLPLTEPGTWGIDYDWGQSPGAMGKAACIALATEFILALTGTSNVLPQRVVSVASQGETILVGDPLAYIREDLTGVPMVDIFLNSVNPFKLRRRAAFLSPNSVQGREQTGFPTP